MEEKVVSKKISLKKKFILLWIVAVAVLVLVFAMVRADFSAYMDGQDKAIAFTLATTKRFDSYKNDREKMVENMYDFFHPHYISFTYEGYKYDNSDAIDAAHDAARALSDLMEKAGYSRYSGTYYLKYTNFGDYVVERSSSRAPFIACGIAMFLILVINICYAVDAKNVMIIDGDRIVCYKGEKTKKEFLVKDIKSVEVAFLKGLRIRGNGVKYKINLLANGEELRSTIMALVSAKAAEATVVTEIKQEAPISNADELWKYKELLDSGVITQEEFEAKKKQLLGL